MGERTSHEPGTFSWADLATSDPEGAKRFYGELFGWEAEDMPAGPDAVYTMLRIDGANVAALSAQREEEAAQGVPPHWNNYVTVDDVDARAARVGELGGAVLMEPFDVLDAGRMAVIADPPGAVLMLWEPRGQIGAQRVNEPGCLTWNDLNTNDTAAAREFYSALFGWRSEPIGGGEVDYSVWFNGDRSNGGMMGMVGDDQGVPPHWLPYFVAPGGVDASLAKVESAGGGLLAGPMEVPAGRFAIVRDPQGAVFALFEGELDD